MASRQQNSNEVFNRNPYILPVLFLIIFLTGFLVLFKYDSYRFVKYYFMPIFNTFSYEISFIINTPFISKFLELVHLDFFIEKSYFYFTSYYVTGDFTLVSLLNFILTTHELPQELNVFRVFIAFIYGNFYINAFNIIIMFPFILIYLIRTKHTGERVLRKIADKKYREEEEKILKNIEKFNNNVDADLYMLMRDEYINSIKDVEVYLLEIIKYSIDINQFRNIYIKMFKNLMFVEQKIIEISNYNENNNHVLFNYNLYEQKYKKYVYIHTPDTLKEKEMFMGKNKYNIYQYWILLFFYAKLVRNFPQAILSKKLGNFLGNKNISVICKFSAAKNVPDYITPYFFYYDLIMSKDINSFIMKIVDRKYCNNFLYKVV